MTDAAAADALGMIPHERCLSWAIVATDAASTGELAPTWEQQRDALIGALVTVTAERDAAYENIKPWADALYKSGLETRKAEEGLAALADGQRIMAAALNTAHAETEQVRAQAVRVRDADEAQLASADTELQAAWRAVDHWRNRATAMHRQARHYRANWDVAEGRYLTAREQVAYFTYAIIQTHNGEKALTREEWERERKETAAAGNPPKNAAQPQETALPSQEGNP